MGYSNYNRRRKNKQGLFKLSMLVIFFEKKIKNSLKNRIKNMQTICSKLCSMNTHISQFSRSLTNLTLSLCMAVIASKLGRFEAFACGSEIFHNPIFWVYVTHTSRYTQYKYTYRMQCVCWRVREWSLQSRICYVHVSSYWIMYIDKGMEFVH